MQLIADEEEMISRDALEDCVKKEREGERDRKARASYYAEWRRDVASDYSGVTYSVVPTDYNLSVEDWQNLHLVSSVNSSVYIRTREATF